MAVTFSKSSLFPYPFPNFIWFGVKSFFLPFSSITRQFTSYFLFLVLYLYTLLHIFFHAVHPSPVDRPIHLYPSTSILKSYFTTFCLCLRVTCPCQENFKSSAFIHWRYFQAVFDRVILHLYTFKSYHTPMSSFAF